MFIWLDDFIEINIQYYLKRYSDKDIPVFSTSRPNITHCPVMSTKLR